MAEDWWLIKGLLLFDVAVFLFVTSVIVWTFPKRIREGVKRNSIRLDGTFSRRRDAKEKEQHYGWLGNVLAVVLGCLIAANVLMIASHRLVMPFPIAGAALEQFDWEPATWQDNLSDPERGNISRQFASWQSPNGGDEPAAGLGRIFPMYLVGVSLGFIGAAVLMIWLCRSYINSLVRFEERVNKRHQEYLVCDMRSRFDSVEAGESGNASS